MAWTSFDKPAAMMRISNTGGANREIKIHPTQKPRALYKRLLYKFAEKGQKIIDTHLGSGSSAIEAHYFDCDFVGMEIDPKIFHAAQERFNSETRQALLI